MSNAASRKELLLVAITLVICIGVCFSPATEAGFIWDDEDYVTMNPNLRDSNGLVATWTEPSSLPQYYPLVHTTFWFEYQAWGLDPLGYHVVNLVLHGLAALLLFLLLRQLGFKWAWAIAILFAVHPVQVESVAWVTERKNCLSLVFYLLSMKAFLSWWLIDEESSSRKTPRYIYALLFYCCALLSKTVTCSLPAALALLYWWRQGRITRPLLKALLPFLLIGIGMASLTVWMETNHVNAQGVDWELSFVERLLIASRAVWFYITSIVWPAGLCFNYPRWVIDVTSPLAWLYSIALIGTLAVLYVKRHRITRGPITAFCLFIGTLFPALGFIDVYPMRYSFVADHFQYLATPFAMVLLVEGVRVLSRKVGIGAKPVLALGLCLLCVLMAVTYRHTSQFQSLQALWRGTIKTNPESWLAMLNLGALELDKGNLTEAKDLLERADRLKDGDPDLDNNLGILYFELGDKKQAQVHFTASLALRNDSPKVHHNLGVTLWDNGAKAEGKQHVKEALRIAPSYVDAHGTMARFLIDEGKHKRAINHLTLALRSRPSDLRLQQGMATCLIKERKFKDAIQHLAVILSVEPQNSDARLSVVACLRKGGKFDLADRHLLEVLSLSPQNEKAQSELRKVLARKTASQARSFVDGWVNQSPALKGILFELLARQMESQKKWSEARAAWEVAQADAQGRQEANRAAEIAGHLARLQGK